MITILTRRKQKSAAPLCACIEHFVQMTAWPRNYCQHCVRGTKTSQQRMKPPTLAFALL